MGVADRLRAAFGRDDFEGMIGVLDANVVWTGITPACRGRDEVRRVFEWHIAQGHRAKPQVVAEGPEKIVVDMHLVEPPPALDLHQVLTIRDDRVVHIQDCPDRATALAEAGLS
jgi:hypothetical protein